MRSVLPRYRIKEPVDLWRALGERVVPKFVSWVLDKFNKRDQESPRVWPMHDESLLDIPYYLRTKLYSLRPNVPIILL